MADIVTLGELLIDFVPTTSNVSLIEAPAFKKAPGGAPANVAAGLAKLGISCAFLGKVGDDPFGEFLEKTLSDLGVNTQGLVFSHEARTALAFVSLKADGEREFMFYRHPSADMLYTPDEVDYQLIKHARIFHFGSISLISEPSRSATLAALAAARENGVLISYDPNLRLALWSDPSAAKDGMLSVWEKVDLIKVSEDELTFLTGLDDIDEAVNSLWHENLKLLVVTLGKEGCRYYTPGFAGFVEGISAKAIDTTGAGDGFVAGLLKGVSEHPEALVNESILSKVCLYANAVGALTTTQLGAIPALPTTQEVRVFLESRNIDIQWS
ncbi:MAG: PfkB family carbohydrate kinase [Brevefilum sp.]|nr:PfkB family carbohydrate kinase [Brevefilum sp.]MDW7755757.1 PfkB family carbohydrate kinase [Brevefilum sp.]